jgi:hypothetical protein
MNIQQLTGLVYMLESQDQPDRVMRTADLRSLLGAISAANLEAEKKGMKRAAEAMKDALKSNRVRAGVTLEEYQQAILTAANQLKEP